jgi:hypothetical protein
MSLNADKAKAINKPYKMVSINYSQISVQKLYRVGTTGDWLNYQDEAIWVNQGETIYAKGIDQYGNETRIISSYTANVTDALPAIVYDGNITTGVRTLTNAYMRVDSSMIGKNIRVNWRNYVYSGLRLKFLDINKNLISQFSSTATEQIILVPAGTYWISATSNSDYFYEIQPAI